VFHRFTTSPRNLVPHVPRTSRGLCADLITEHSRYLETWTSQMLNFLLLAQTPPYCERVATFAGADESPLLQRLDGIAIRRQRAYFFIIFRPPQNWVATERIGFKLVSILDVRQEVLFHLSEFR
jgi:hypothetical protein